MMHIDMQIMGHEGSSSLRPRLGLMFVRPSRMRRILILEKNSLIHFGFGGDADPALFSNRRCFA